MLLTTLERTKQVSAGNLPWISEMIEAREKLITHYFALLTIAREIDNSSNDEPILEDSAQAIKDFCMLLVDYLTRGHFVIYPKILTIMEHVSNRRLTIARRLVPRIYENTEKLLQFNDMYCDELNEKNIAVLNKALTKVGELLEVRFKLEDRMVVALQIMDNKMEAAKTEALNKEQPTHKDFTEKRQFTRVAYKAVGMLTMDGKAPIEITVNDLSLKSALIKTNQPNLVNLNDTGTLDIIISPEITITFSIKIARVEGCSVGVICTSIDLDSMSELKHIIQYNCGNDTKLLDRDLEHLVK